MSDNEILLKECEWVLSRLQQMTPINPDDVNLSGCDDKTRETLMNIINEDYFHWKNRVNQLTLIVTLLKQQTDGDGDV